MTTVSANYRAPRKAKLDKKMVAALKPAEHTFICWDTEVTGLGCRVTPKGHKAFVLQYRINGRERRMTIGEFGTWSVPVARDEANTLKLRVDRGEDPLQEEQDKRGSPTVNGLIERYRQDVLPTRRLETQRTYDHFLKMIAKAIGRRKVADIRLADIDKLHKSMKANPSSANMLLTTASVLFGKAVKWDLIDRNPCRGVERYDLEPRERFLSQEEIARLSDVLTAWPHRRAAAAIRFLLLTGARRGEVLQMRRSDVDFERAVWSKPSHHTKSKKLHRVPLSAGALEVLASVEGEQPFKCDLFREWAKIRKIANLEDVRIHDLRHTHASLLASAGASLPMVGKLLGHVRAETTLRYSHFYDEPLREATEGVANKIASAGKPKAPVVDLKSTVKH